MARFRTEKFKKNESFIVVVMREMVFIGFVVLLVLNMITTSKIEDRVLLVVIEMVFATTRIYCKVKSDQSNKNNYERKGDKKR